MVEPRPRSRGLVLVLGLALILRLAAAVVVEAMARRRGTLCLFPDADIYWQLAGAILQGGPYRVMQWEQPHFALRTPGFPLFLAACRALFGDSTLAARLAQVALGVGSVALVERLARSVGLSPRAALIAAALAAVDPFAIGFTVLLLSEALFLPLMLGFLWGLAIVWAAGGTGKALTAGAAAGAAVLVKPSFAPFLPLVLSAWFLCGSRRIALPGALAITIGFAAIMAPWWARNAQVYGRFVGTALWGGASLYDGWNPAATGASDMRFLDAPEFRDLDEVAQDRTLNALAWRFAREHPGRVLELAAIKLGRYWSPWLNAEGFRAAWLMVGSSLWSLPIFALILVGAWERRRDARALALLLGPILCFAAIHAVFVGSVRYRMPGEVPALALAAGAIARRWPGRSIAG